MALGWWLMQQVDVSHHIITPTQLVLRRSNNIFLIIILLQWCEIPLLSVLLCFCCCFSGGKIHVIVCNSWMHYTSLLVIFKFFRWFKPFLNFCFCCFLKWSEFCIKCKSLLKESNEKMKARQQGETHLWHVRGW